MFQWHAGGLSDVQILFDGSRELVQDSPSIRLHELLDWSAIAGHLKGLYRREKSGASGLEPYNRLSIFKLMLPIQGHPMHPLYRAFNKKIGAIRFKVEQAFGTMKRRFHLSRARYFGTAKVLAPRDKAALG